MANNFKSDDSFLRKLAVGAAGTNATIKRLVAMHYKPIELERGSRGFKIWKKIKIKRVRVPDILCLASGLRFESRGKTKVEISMSHSLKDPKRAWDAGMRDDDYVSIVILHQTEESPTEPEEISPVHFILVRDLKAAFAAKQIAISQPKGVEEGSEIRVVWTCASANLTSIVELVEPTRIRLRPQDGSRVQTIQLSRARGQIQLLPQVAENSLVEANQIVAAVVPVTTSLPAPKTVSESFFVERLKSVNLSERYAAAKALRYLGFGAKTKKLLTTRVDDLDEDIYVQLEAAAALAAFDYNGGWEFIQSRLNSDNLGVALETQLETVIVASEIPSTKSETLLIAVLTDHSRDEELRAGAAWALGQFHSSNSAAALVSTFNSSPMEIRTEAARALLSISEKQIPYLIDRLKSDDPANRDGIAWVLARCKRFDPQELVVKNDDENLRQWTSYVIGHGRDRFEEAELKSICESDPQVYFAASVLWQIVQSWINEITEY